MMVRVTDLKSLLNSPVREAVVGDLTGLADSTISNQSGLTGMALKPVVAAAKRADADALRKGIDQVLPSIVEELEPHWSAYAGSGQDNFGRYLAEHEDSVVDSVLKVGDSYIDRAPEGVKKLYPTMRGKAGKLVAPVLPEFGEIIERHAK